jgi:tRNA-binding protein
MSEALVLGLHDAGGKIVLIAPDQPVPNGEKLC